MSFFVRDTSLMLSMTFYCTANHPPFMVDNESNKHLKQLNPLKPLLLLFFGGGQTYKCLFYLSFQYSFLFFYLIFLFLLLNFFCFFLVILNVCDLRLFANLGEQIQSWVLVRVRIFSNNDFFVRDTSLCSVWRIMMRNNLFHPHQDFHNNDNYYNHRVYRNYSHILSHFHLNRRLDFVYHHNYWNHQLSST